LSQLFFLYQFCKARNIIIIISTSIILSNSVYCALDFMYFRSIQHNLQSTERFLESIYHFYKAKEGATYYTTCGCCKNNLISQSPISTTMNIAELWSTLRELNVYRTPALQPHPLYDNHIFIIRPDTCGVKQHLEHWPLSTIISNNVSAYRVWGEARHIIPDFWERPGTPVAPILSMAAYQLSTIMNNESLTMNHERWTRNDERWTMNKERWTTNFI